PYFATVAYASQSGPKVVLNEFHAYSDVEESTAAFEEMFIGAKVVGFITVQPEPTGPSGPVKSSMTGVVGATPPPPPPAATTPLGADCFGVPGPALFDAVTVTATCRPWSAATSVYVLLVAPVMVVVQFAPAASHRNHW